MSVRGKNILSISPWLRRRAGDSWRKRWLNEFPSLAVQASIEPTGCRDYCTGDDLARVDWNRCARLDELVVQQYFGNELRSLDIWIDHSKSMMVGDGAKLAWAKQFASLLTLQALNEGESVGMFSVASEATRIAPVIRRRDDLSRLLLRLDKTTPANEPLELAQAARSYLRFRRGSATLLVLSDFFEPTSSGLVQGLQVLSAAGVGVCLLQLHTSDEVNPRGAGRFQLEEIESRSALTTTIREADLAAYRREVALYLKGVRRVCHRAGALWARVSVDDSFDDVLSVLTRTSRIGRTQ